MNTPSPQTPPRVAIIGGGLTGLMAAGVVRTSNLWVDLFDAKPSVGRKFLVSGKGGVKFEELGGYG